MASLVIFLAQFASLAHATQHPVDAEDLLCLVCLNAEQDKYLSVDTGQAVFEMLAGYCVITGISGHFVLSAHVSYSSRAPPAQTV